MVSFVLHKVVVPKSPYSLLAVRRMTAHEICENPLLESTLAEARGGEGQSAEGHTDGANGWRAEGQRGKGVEGQRGRGAEGQSVEELAKHIRGGEGQSFVHGLARCMILHFTQ